MVLKYMFILKIENEPQHLNPGELPPKPKSIVRATEWNQTVENCIYYNYYFYKQYSDYKLQAIEIFTNIKQIILVLNCGQMVYINEWK